MESLQVFLESSMGKERESWHDQKFHIAESVKSASCVWPLVAASIGSAVR